METLARVAILMAMALVAPSVARAELPAETIRLPNGLRVLLAPDDRASLVAVRVSYLAGTADDPRGLRGLAHLTEHLVATRTQHIPSVISVLRSIGASGFNASTSLDSTSYFETVPPECLDSVLWLESDRMGFAAAGVTPERMEAARAAVRNEYLQRQVDVVLGALPDDALAELFPPGHPYSDPNPAVDADDVSAADVRAFLSTWYLPSNAILAIAGRFDRDAVLATITRDFGPLTTALPPSRPALVETPLANCTLVLQAPVTSTSVSISWRTPRYGTREDVGLDLVAAALSGNGNERLSHLILDTGLVTAIRSHEQSLRAASIFSIDATVAPGVDALQVVAAIEQTVTELAQGARAPEWARARRRWREQVVVRTEAPWGRAAWMSSLAGIGEEPGPAYDWGRGRYDAITDDELRALTRTWLDQAPRVITTILPDPSAPYRASVVRREVRP